MNVLRYSYESKLASAAVVAMLALSGIFAAFLIIPRATAASGPSITLTPSSGKYGSSVTVFGTGFAPSSAITLTMTTGATTPATLTTIKNSLLSSGTLTTDADGNFEAQFTVPSAAGGSQTVTATDAKGNSATATFTVQPSVTLTAKSGFPGQALSSPSFTIHGFGSSEQLVFSQSIFGSLATASTPTSPTGDATVTFSALGWSSTVPLTTGGTKTITVTGATSGLSASVSFTVNAAIAFYIDQGSITVFSVDPSQYNSFYIEGYGFPKGTIAANSITINGQAVQNPSITVGSDGTFGVGAGNHVPVTFSVGLAQGMASITVGGSTFNYASGNIVCPTNNAGQCPTPNTGSYVVGWGGPFVLSAGKGVPSISLDSSSYIPDGSTPVLVVGFGNWGGTPTLTCSAASCTFGTVYSTELTTSRKAFYAFTATVTAVVGLGSNPGFTSSGTPATYTVTATQGSNTATATFGITQAVEPACAPAGVTADYKTDPVSVCHVTAYGFGGTESVDLYIGSKFLTTVQASSGTASFTSSTTVDLPAGTYAFKAVGETSTASATSAAVVTYTPAVQFVSSTTGDLTVHTGPAGTQTVLLSGTTYGIHGLNASSTYKVTWGIGPNAQVLATFTTDANGKIPGAGVQFAVPAGTSGVHILSIRTSAGTDVIFGMTKASDTTSSLSGYTGQYGDLLFLLTANIQLSPTGGGVGTVVTVSGTALTAGTTYYVWLSGEGVYRATFTATSTGSVPAGVNFTFPAEPTSIAGTNNENGTAYTVCVGTASQFQGGTCANTATFMLHATASLNVTTAAPGQAVTVSALGLLASQSYSVVFNKQVVATFTTNTVGSGSATFTVPTGTAPGTYQVKIQRGSSWVLLSPPTLTVTSGAVVTTQSLTPSAPTQTTLNGQPAVAVSYTNTLSVSVTSVVYAVVTNSAGQVVYYTTATITVSPGPTPQTAYAVLAGLPHGTYTVTLFAIVNNQVASTTTTTQVTI